MKTIDKIPTSKISRAGKMLQTGLKVGKNYAGYYGSKILQGEADKNLLDQKNAADIMDSLQQLKGGGLKVAQMLSMEKSLLPKAYLDQFSLAQFSVPPLSAPLVKKTFRKYLGKNPEDLFDSFDYVASFAASIGQVHQAILNGKKLAVKIQYPGVGESIKSDLAMLKPMASKLLRLNLADADKYFGEVQDKLIEETNYILELRNSQEMTEACQHIEGFSFPRYYPEFSSERIITMDWMEGVHLSKYLEQDLRNDQKSELGQRIWDMFMFQIHQLRKVHADPHPGNILINADSDICILDFGCIKELPDSFYIPYFALTEPGIIEDRERFEQILVQLEILYPHDTEAERAHYYDLFYKVLSLLLKPFQSDTWDFSDSHFFEQISIVGEQLAKDTLTAKYKANRGSKHFIYVNRTFFGLYQLMHMIGAVIRVPYTATAQVSAN